MSDTARMIEDLRRMVAAKGANLYGGEAVTQEQHALQCAQLAENESAPPSLIVAALLHDIGHLIDVEFEAALQRSEDRFHENLGHEYLSRWFGPEVTEPVRLHVAAKRYLCATDESYHNRLSPASAHTLKIQGGPMSSGEVAEFEANPHHRNAVRLRIWDDEGKDPDMATGTLDHFLNIVRQMAEVA